MKDSKILQIMPAEGWWATYKDTKSGEILWVKLVCWALVQGENKRYGPQVVGMDGPDFISECDDTSNFELYVFDPERREEKVVPEMA